MIWDGQKWVPEHGQPGPGGQAGPPAWGTITGTMSAQTDLQSGLDAKAGSVHVHSIAAVTGLQTALDGKFSPTMLVKTQDQLAIGNAYADVTELGFAALAGATYAFEFYLIADSDAATTGIDVAVNGPTSPLSINYTQCYWTSATVLAERPAVAYNANTASTGSAGTIRAVYKVAGVLRNNSNPGTLIPRIKRENVGSGPNVRAGSYGVVWRLA